MDYLPGWQIIRHDGGVTAEESDILQPVIRRNVDALMGWRRMKYAKQLAQAMGLQENAVANKISGRRRWQIEDLPVLATALGVQASDLLLPAAQLAAKLSQLAEREAATGTDSYGAMHSVDIAVDNPCYGQDTRQGSPQVRAFSGDITGGRTWPRYQPASEHVTRLLDRGSRAPNSGHSGAIVTRLGVTRSRHHANTA